MNKSIHYRLYTQNDCIVLNRLLTVHFIDREYPNEVSRDEELVTSLTLHYMTYY